MGDELPSDPPYPGDSSPVPPGVEWTDPVLVKGFWHSYDQSGRRSVLGPSGWKKAMWPSVPLTRLERWLRIVAIGLVGVLLASVLVTMFSGSCHNVGVCKPGTTAEMLSKIGSLAGWVSVVVAVVAVIHHAFVKRRSARAAAAARRASVGGGKDTDE